MSKETVSEKIDHKIRTGLAIMIFIAVSFAVLADFYTSIFDSSYALYYTIFGSAVGMLTGSLVRVRYLLAGFIGGLGSLALAGYWYANDHDKIWAMATTSFMMLGANMLFFWKLHKLQTTRHVIKNSKTATRMREKDNETTP